MSIVQSARIGRVGGTDADYRILEAAVRGINATELRRLTSVEAITAIGANTVDLILLDLTLPSAEIVRVLQVAAPGGGARSRVPVIVSGPAGTEDRMQSCLQHGAEDFIASPFEQSNALLIARRVHLALQRRWLHETTVRLQTRPSTPEDTAVIELYSNASNRFIPREFLEHLGRKAITDVKLGDHIESEMTVFFSDIRDFTALSETLSPQENFDFLNSYLKQATPIIRARHGFVDKYIGDAIMALFPRSSGDALMAASELQQKIGAYNLGRQSAGYVDIKIGIGLHRGRLILGTIGEDERMQTTVISDAVNVASRIEGLTKTFGASLLVSGPVVDGLTAEQRRSHELRHLGAVKTKGKTRSVEIFECYDNDPDDLKAHKSKTLDLFARAMAEFRKGMFITAGTIFRDIAAMHPGDTVAAHYRESCALTTVAKRGKTPWDGAEKIEVK